MNPAFQAGSFPLFHHPRRHSPCLPPLLRALRGKHRLQGRHSPAVFLGRRPRSRSLPSRISRNRPERRNAPNTAGRGQEHESTKGGKHENNPLSLFVSSNFRAFVFPLPRARGQVGAQQSLFPLILFMVKKGLPGRDRLPAVCRRRQTPGPALPSLPLPLRGEPPSRPCRTLAHQPRHPSPWLSTSSAPSAVNPAFRAERRSLLSTGGGPARPLCVSASLREVSRRLWCALRCCYPLPSCLNLRAAAHERGARCGCNSAGRVPASQAGCRGFESRRPLQPRLPPHAARGPELTGCLTPSVSRGRTLSRTPASVAID